MQPPCLPWQPASKPTNNCTAQSQPPQRNVFHAFNYEIGFGSQTSARNLWIFFFSWNLLFLRAVVICLPAAKADVLLSGGIRGFLHCMYSLWFLSSMLSLWPTVNQKAEPTVSSLLLLPLEEQACTGPFKFSVHEKMQVEGLKHGPAHSSQLWWFGWKQPSSQI